MSFIFANGINHYYEVKGQGQPIVFIHGAFVDSEMWNPQVEFFCSSYRVLRYDLRGHYRTGESKLSRYRIETFADDLKSILDQLNIDKIILCGLSLGGMIAQSFAVKYTEKLRCLILSDTAVSVRLTLSDKFQRYVLAPKWLMMSIIRWMSVPKFINFSIKLAQWTRSSDWFGKDPTTTEYVRKAMLRIPTSEYLKIYDAIYEFDLLELEKITVPTLILNGEGESKSVFRHTKELLKQIPNSKSKIIAGAGHTSNLENPTEFNQLVSEFLI